MKKVSAATLAKSTLAHRRPSREEAEEAVRTLVAWAGDDPTREGLRETPRRVIEAYEEYFRGYREDPVAILKSPTFEQTGGYRDMVLLRGIRVESHCEHHMAPFIGVAHVAYIPNGHLAGLSKLARVVEVFAKRLQTQEALTADIAHAVAKGLSARGVATMVEAEHHCMATRGVRHAGTQTVTTCFLGLFDTDSSYRDRFLHLAHGVRPAPGSLA
ncbi:MAG: GTP cyclohydrolase I FolE [Hyphomicrobiaceae bacterium]